MRRKKDKDMPERALIGWIRSRVSLDARKVPIGPGDDMALVAGPSKQTLVAIDTIAEGVDFVIGQARAEAIGRKALAVNLSDIAAMGALPTWCMASVALREGLGGDFAKRLASGLIKLARKYDCPLVGGDVTGWAGGVVVTVAIGGVPAGKKPVRRNGARPGDVVFVTGSLGGSILGKHLTFEPRIAEGAWLARNASPSAMIDISDGLGVDAAHIADESGVGILLDAARIPVSAAARRLAKSSGGTPLDHAARDGEDFELLFTARERKAGDIESRWPFKTRLTAIGKVRRGRHVLLETGAAEKVRIDTEGYEHLG